MRAPSRGHSSLQAAPDFKRTPERRRPRQCIRLCRPVDAALPPAPASVADEAGQPRFGSYQGTLDRVDLALLSSEHRPLLPLRPLKHKRWLYSFLATPEVMVVQSVANLT